MDWIISLAHRRNESADASQRFEREAEELWNSLKTRIRECQASYERCYPPGNERVEYHERPSGELVFRRLAAPGQGQQENEVSGVTIRRKRRTIKADYSTDQPELLVTVGPSKDGPATLCHDALSITIDRACELILRPVLFDDLPSDDS
jgi:hypothetical protein